MPLTPLGVTLQQTSYRGWNVWEIQNGPLTLVLVPQVGGRIMSMQWRGHDLSFTQPEREGKVEEVAQVADVREKKREMGFPLWGGEKTWLAPQDHWTDGVPFLDLDSGTYDFRIERATPEFVAVQMMSPIDRETGIQITRTLAVSSLAGAWTVTHRLHNTSQKESTWGVWSVAMMCRPGKVYMPTARSSSYPDGVKAFREEGESARVREDVVRRLGNLAEITCGNPVKFKFGVDSQQDERQEIGWMLSILDVSGFGLVGYGKRMQRYMGHSYGHGCLAEVFNSDQYPYFEMEMHGPLVSLKPGEHFELSEKQTLFELTKWPETEDEVSRLAQA